MDDQPAAFVGCSLTDDEDTLGSRMLIHSVVLFLMLTFGTQPEDELRRFEYSERIMGVQFGVQFYASDQAIADEAAKKVFERIRELDLVLSDYKSKSEINLLCRSAPHEEAVSISQDLSEVFRLSRKVHDQSGGAFDVTIGPASRLWRVSIKRRRLPDDDRISEARSRMGMNWLVFGGDQDRPTLAVQKPNMQLDFGGIAKGYAADQAIQVLDNVGITSALIDASGDIVVSDAPPGARGWRVQIPSATDKANTMMISRSAIATSGDVYQYLEVDGVRYSHIVDPTTGRAVTKPRIVTVIHRHGAMADAYASVVSVLGKRGLKFAEDCEFEAQIISARNKELTELEIHRTPKFGTEIEESLKQDVLENDR